MGKYIKLFETHSQYTAFTQTEDFILPNVSYCEDQTDIIHYNPLVPPQETRLMVTYNVEDASEPTYIYGYYVEGGTSVLGVDMFDKVEIDGTEVSIASLDEAEGMYQLSVGEHTVAYTLKDPTTIANEAFYGCSSIVNVEIPNSVTSIGDGAFNVCNSLTSLTIGSGVTSIGESAFSGCTSLTSVTIPDSVTSIGSNAFRNCNGLTSLTIGSGVTSIGGMAFNGCTGLTSVEIDNNTIMSVTYTYENNLKNLFGAQVTEYIIGDSVTSIGSNAFSNCSGLTSVTIGSGVTTIGESAFQGCTSLTSVTIPDSVTTIGEMAFNGCSSLTSVTLGSGVTIIGDGAFGCCPLDSASEAAVEAISPNSTQCAQ